MTHELKALGWYEVRGKRCANVANPVECCSWWHLREVMIDGTLYRVLGVESYGIPTHRAGEPIGLMVEEVPA